MKLDSAGLQILTPEECLSLLGSAPVGRVIFTDRALPAVQPVNFLLDGRDVVIRTALGSKLAAAVADTVVAFEADQFDAAMRSGWSVTAIGRARAVRDYGEIERLASLPLAPWAPGSRDHFIVMRVEEITGRRLSSG